ncbi:MAG: PKD-like domain-containing protein, partial [Dokdonia sp.]
MKFLPSSALAGIFLLFSFTSLAQGPGSLFVDAGSDQIIDCTSTTGSATLTATYLETFETIGETYTIDAIPYAPPFAFDGLANSLNPNNDDEWSGVDTLPFDFCFFGNVETQFQVGSNGVIRFDVDPTDTSNDFGFSVDLPNNSDPALGEANVFTPVHDIDPTVSGTEEIGYEVLGTFPNRVLVVSFFEVPMYSTGCNSLLATHMAVFYEFSNVIEIYIQDKPSCPGWNGGNAALGIQNDAGTTAYVPPGRNTSDSPWTTSNEAWRFTPDGVQTSVFEWLDDTGTVVSTNPTFTVSPTVTTTYTARVTYTNCNGSTVQLSDDAIVTVDAPFTVDIGADSIQCNDTPVPLNGDTGVAGISYQWLLNGTPLAGETSPTYTAATAGLNTYTLEASDGVCTLSDSVDIGLYETPTATAPADITVCDAAPFNNQEIFNLDLLRPTILNGQDPTIFDVTFHTSLAGAQMDTGAITTTSGYDTGSTTIWVRVDNNGFMPDASCNAIVSFDITVNDTPVGTNATAAICSTDAVGHDLTANTDIASTYSWIAADNPNVTGESLAATPGAIITDALTTSSLVDEQVVYTVTPTSSGPGGCVGDPFTVTVTVSPVPTGTDQNIVICADNALAIDLTTVVNIPSTFSWVAADNPLVTGETLSPSTATVIADIISNPTTTDQDVIYTVTPTSSGTASACPGPDFTVTVTVRPSPVGTDTTLDLCESAAFTHDLTADVSIPSNFVWTAADNPDVTGESIGAFTSTTISDVLVNTSSVPTNVVYTITPTSTGANPCTGADFTFTVTVFPEPIGTDANDTICSTDALNHDLNGDVDVVSTFSWVAADNPNVSGETTTVTTTSSITDVLINTTTTDQTVLYTITPTSASAPACVGADFTYTVIVSPEPVGTNAVDTSCSDIALAHDLSMDVSIPSTFSWVALDNPDVTGETLTPATTAIINDVLTNVSGVSQVVTYEVIPTSTGTLACPGALFTVTVTVDPKPVGTNATDDLCESVPLNHDLNLDVDIPSAFEWQAADNPNITGETTTISTTATITDVLVNTGTAIETVIYTIIPSSNAAGCQGDPFTYTVTVFPEPNGVSSTEAICSNDTLAHDLNADVDIASTFIWVATDNPLVSGETISPTSTALIDDTLVNTTTSDQVVVYTVTPTASNPGACVGADFTVTVTVSPEPVGTDTLDTSCSDVALAHDLNADVNIPSTFSWLAIDNPNVTGESTTAVTSSTITDMLNNVSGTPQVVVYQVTPTATNPLLCVGAVFTVTVTVDPEPVGTNTTEEICTTETLAHDLNADVDIAATFSWVALDNPNVTGESTTAVMSDLIDDTLTNTSVVDQTVVYEVTPFSALAGGCEGDVFTVTVTVVATPVHDAIPDQNVCDTFTFPVITQMGMPRPAAIYSTMPGGAGTTFTQGQTVTYFDFFPTAYPITIYTYENTGGVANCENPDNSFTLTINRSPEATPPLDYPLCDEDNDGVENFDLSSRVAEILGSLNPGDHTVVFYETAADADAGGPSTIVDDTMHPFVPDFPVTDPPSQVVFARVTEQLTGVFCYDVVPLTLILNPDPIALDDTFMVCDDNVPDGIVVTDLSVNDPDIAGTNTTGVTVSYHNTPADAENGTNAVDKFNYTTLPPPYPYTLYTRVTDDITGCHEEGEIDITVLQAPSIVTPTPYEICDDDNDGFAVFTLGTKNDEIINGDPTLTIEYYFTESDAQNAPLGLELDQTAYTNVDPYTDRVWARVENPAQCFTVVEVALLVYDSPVPNTNPEPYVLCDTNVDGVEVFDLTSRENEILGGLDPAVFSIVWYSDPVLAGDPSGIEPASDIADPVNYVSGTSLPTPSFDTVYARVINTTQSVTTRCFEVVTLALEVQPIPTPVQPPAYELCDDLQSGSTTDETAIFDLRSQDAIITGGVTSWAVSYYFSELDAIAGDPATTLPDFYANVVPAAQTIWARVADT